MVFVFKNVEERYTAIKYRPFRLLDHLEKYCLFSDFQYGFRSCQQTADLQSLVSNRIARAFNMLGLFFFSQ